jgi:hypothetical protein
VVELGMAKVEEQCKMEVSEDYTAYCDMHSSLQINFSSFFLF